jgi:hypothetical protein
MGKVIVLTILLHTVGIPVATESDANQSLFFTQNGLVDVPAGGEMREDDGTHGS